MNRPTDKKLLTEQIANSARNDFTVRIQVSDHRNAGGIYVRFGDQGDSLFPTQSPQNKSAEIFFGMQNCAGRTVKL